MKKTAAVLCAALLTLSACGESAEDEARASIKAGVLEGEAGVAAGIELTEDQAECFADGLVDEVGVEKLQEYGMLDEDNQLVEDAQVDNMTKEDADEAAGVVTDCVDVKELLREGLGGAGGPELTDEQTNCILEAIDEDTLEEAFSAQLQGEDATNPMQDSMGAIMECATASQ